MRKNAIISIIFVAFAGLVLVGASCGPRTNPDRTLSGGDLLEPCEPNATACSGNAVMLCDPEGRWSLVMDCEALASDANHRFKCQSDQSGSDVSCFPVSPGDKGAP